MERAVFIGRLRKRENEPPVYEITIPKKIVKELNLQPGELLEVTLVRLGIEAPGWLKRSFKMALSIKYKIKQKNAYLEELIKRVG